MALRQKHTWHIKKQTNHKEASVAGTEWDMVQRGNGIGGKQYSFIGHCRDWFSL